MECREGRLTGCGDLSDCFESVTSSRALHHGRRDMPLASSEIDIVPGIHVLGATCAQHGWGSRGASPSFRELTTANGRKRDCVRVTERVGGARKTAPWSPPWRPTVSPLRAAWRQIEQSPTDAALVMGRDIPAAGGLFGEFGRMGPAAGNAPSLGERGRYLHQYTICYSLIPG